MIIIVYFHSLYVGRSCGVNSSIILFKSNAFTDAIYNYLLSHYEQITSVVYKFDHYLEMMLSSSSSSSSSSLSCVYLQDVLPDFIIDYPQAEEYFSCCSTNSGNAAIVCFPLQPKPHQIADKEWVYLHWTKYTTISV